MRNYLFIMLFILISSVVYAQSVNKNQPNIKTEVNVYKDEYGNVIAYDSTYVETWSSTGHNIDTDSLMQNLLLNNNFFDDDFFNNNYYNKDTTITQDFSTPIFPDFDYMNEQLIKQLQEFQKLFEMYMIPNKKDIKKEENIYGKTVKI